MNNLACLQTATIGSSESRIQTQMDVFCKVPVKHICGYVTHVATRKRTQSTKANSNCIRCECNKNA